MSADTSETIVSTRWPIAAALAADEKKASHTLIFDVGEVLAVTDHFVITSGSSAPQVKAITDSIEERIREAGGPSPLRVEGLDTRQWVLIDYGEFVVHVFDTDTRDFYQLEKLWGDRPRVEWQSD